MRISVLVALVSLCCAGQPVTFSHEPGKIHVSSSGKPFGALYCAREQDKPFFFPLRTSTGIVVTRAGRLSPNRGTPRTTRTREACGGRMD